TTGLTDGTYNLKLWYETVCHGDTIKSGIYTTSFTIDNTTPTSDARQQYLPVVRINGNILTADFNESANVRLYSVSGQLIDQRSVEESYSAQLEKGLYILSANGKSVKISIK
ncbi:MAG: T9SS type A sorting domain-containing protein, partial [Prevotellaceae bacterium]|nr:T9SS type A sorting domain-containing protein [Prevotellaceae bacterium]